jgi:SAM-dependent methyltransferase
MSPYKRYAPAARILSTEALGQLAGSENLEDDIALCKYQTIEPYFLKYLPKNERVLEAGCGRGRWVFYLRRLGYDIVGIDIAQSDIAFALKHDPSIPISTANVLHTIFPDQSFGAVISLGVVEHFETGPREAFGEVLRVLKPNGVFLVTVPTQNLLRIALVNRLKDLQNSLRKLRKEELAFEEYRYARREFGGLLRQSGFHIIDIAQDDFVPPKNMGLYADSRFFQHPSRMWELNFTGRMMRSFLGTISPWLICSGTLWVCRKPA